MIAIICAAILAVAAIAVTIIAKGKRLFRLNLEASMVAQGLMYECLSNLGLFKSYLLLSKRTELDFGTDIIKLGLWPWQRNYCPVVIVEFSHDEDVGPIHESFMNGLKEYLERKDGNPPVRFPPILRFRRKEIAHDDRESRPEVGSAAAEPNQASDK